MKMKKTLGIVLAVLLVSAMFLPGAAAASGDTKELDSIIKNMDAAMADVTSFDADMQMEMGMEIMGQQMDILYDMAMSIILDPLQMDLEMDMDMGGSAMEIDMYLSDGVLYTGMDGAWTSMDLGESGMDMDQYMVQDNYQDITGDFENMTLVGTVDFDGNEAYEIQGVVSSDYIKEVLNSGMMDSMGISGDSIDESHFENIGDIAVTFYVYTQSYLFAGYEMDLSSVMGGIVDAIVAGMSEGADAEEMGDFSMSVSKFAMSAEYSDYNEVTDIEVPAEALAA